MTIRNEHRKILGIIKTIRESFIGAEYVYTNGSCFQFYLILRRIFPHAIAYYNGDHVITLINNRMYDITGEIRETKGYIPFCLSHEEEEWKDIKYRMLMK